MQQLRRLSLRMLRLAVVPLRRGHVGGPARLLDQRISALASSSAVPPTSVLEAAAAEHRARPIAAGRAALTPLRCLARLPFPLPQGAINGLPR